MVDVKMLFDKPRSEIAPLMLQTLRACQGVTLVAGFVTPEGINPFLSELKAHPHKLRHLVVGAATQKAYQALDGLIQAGVPRDRLRLCLGYSRATKAGARSQFYRYHPMLHSKVYLFDMPDGSVHAFIGSNNLTSYAMLGMNIEASVWLRGATTEDPLQAARAHVAECVRESIPAHGTSEVKPPKRRWRKPRKSRRKLWRHW